jgi:hypothetical protein
MHDDRLINIDILLVLFRFLLHLNITRQSHTANEPVFSACLSYVNEQKLDTYRSMFLSLTYASDSRRIRLLSMHDDESIYVDMSHNESYDHEEFFDRDHCVVVQCLSNKCVSCETLKRILFSTTSSKERKVRPNDVVIMISSLFFSFAVIFFVLCSVQFSS